MFETDKPEPLLLKPSEAAELLGIGRSKIYALLTSGEIPSLRIGPKTIRIQMAALKAWLKQQEQNR